MAEYNWWDDRTIEDNDEHFCLLLNDTCYASKDDCRDCIALMCIKKVIAENDKGSVENDNR